ncbi:MAG: Holliday junction branch migration protein RuvA [Clostridiaceae bacterium]|mgnify:CR=1 FL=1|nr:Holliday junction branch migration protein RuvA [Clostridiaceae bacterium]
MIAYLKGILVHKNQDSIIIDVNGVGYKVFTSPYSLGSDIDIGSTIKVYTHFYVRENIQDLYGFLTMEELKMFEQLLTVSGVGPKAAISLISVISPSDFALSVLSENIENLTKAPGIGKKTAQRIIFELKDKIKKEHKDLPVSKDNFNVNIKTDDNKAQEAITALIMLGYTSQEAKKAVDKVFDANSTVEQLIKDALKQMIT